MNVSVFLVIGFVFLILAILFIAVLTALITAIKADSD
jgi:hypothetical protein